MLSPTLSYFSSLMPLFFKKCLCGDCVAVHEHHKKNMNASNVLVRVPLYVRSMICILDAIVKTGMLLFF